VLLVIVTHIEVQFIPEELSEMKLKYKDCPMLTFRGLNGPGKRMEPVLGRT
jgi:hypothetical protein